MTFELHPQARDEYLASIAWYQKQQNGLGNEFSLKIEESFDRILADPESYRLAGKLIRVIRVARFPYSIFYHYDPSRSRIFVTSVSHQRRDPNSWQNRSIL